MSWAAWSEALRTTPAGNDGGLMLPWFEAEITPTVAHARPVRVGLEGAPPARQVRALVEGQLMAMRRHSAWMTVEPQSIRATGGASANREILQVMADVFGVPVTVADSSGSAALGAALRAWQAHAGVGWPEVVGRFIDSDREARILSVDENVTTYRALQERYIALEKAALSGDRLPPP